MMRAARALTTILMVLLADRATYAASGFEDSEWIWADTGTGTGASFPGEVCRLRTTFAIPENPHFTSAEVFITADNLYTLYLNGRLVGQSADNPNAWNKPKRFDVSSLIVAGDNVMAVEAVNTVRGAAGLLVKLVARAADGQQVAVSSNGRWKGSAKAEPNSQQADFDEKAWRPAIVVGQYGDRPWGAFAKNLEKISFEPPWPGNATPKNWAARVSNADQHGGSEPLRVVETPPPADFAWPEAVAFLGDDCSLYREGKGKITGTTHDSLGVTVFTARKSRAYPEHDLPAPIKVGRKLFLLRPARPGVEPRLLLDAGKGAIGSPHASIDGRWIYLSMALDGEPFFHIYRISAAGGAPQRLTDGPFHDIDPAELADGRIVFTSTRIGTYEEYHCPPSRALFTMTAEGKEIRPLPNTFIFDNEAEQLADGRILFIRSDNFFDRGKVETLLHAVHPDGSEGYTEFGLDLGPEYGGRLRAFHCGSPAPLADGRVAFVSSPGITIARPGSAAKDQQHIRIDAGDVAALADGRLLCTVARMKPYDTIVRKEKRITHDYSYEMLAILDPDGKTVRQTTFYDSQGEPLHSPVFVGPRQRPPVLAEKVQRSKEDDPGATGFFFCQNARFTKNDTAGWPHVRAVRVLAGKGLTVRSSHAYIVHAGNEVTELGTVPLAPDGSFYVEVPADRAIAFQAVDAEGRSEINEMSWIYVRPGEQRSCLGCHQPRQAAPTWQNTLGLAMQSKPLRVLDKGRPHRFRGNNPAVTGLMELQFDRYREVAGLNRHAETADPLATSAVEVAALAAELDAPNADLRIAAAQRLSVFRDPASAPALAKRLQDSEREVRVAAAIALAACGDRSSVPPLLEALDDAEPLVAQAAAVAIENLTGAAQPFNAFGSRSVRAAQAQQWRAWFQATTWAAIEQTLVEQVQRGDRDAVRRAAVTLGHVGGDLARTALREYVSKQRSVNPIPEWRKTHQGDGTRFNSLADVNPRTIQAAVRSLGSLKDAASVPMLLDALKGHSDPATGNLFVAEAAAEALGRIGGPAAEAGLIDVFAGLTDYIKFTNWYGDHTALMACHASPVHYFIVESLDALASKQTGRITPQMIRAVPTDPDRALFPFNDDCEAIFGRVIRRSALHAAVVETCLAVLGDPQAQPNKEIETAFQTYAAWAGTPDPENRAAQILSLVCRDVKYEPRVRAALERYRLKPPSDLPRAFTGGGLPKSLPTRNWVCFFLARELGNLADRASVDALLAVVEQCPPESAAGHPDPTDPTVLFLQNELTPCYRAAAAWALGQIGDRRAAATLVGVVGDLRNATDTRYAAAEALGRLRDPASMAAIRKMSADYPEVSTRKLLLKICAN